MPFTIKNAAYQCNNIYYRAKDRSHTSFKGQSGNFKCDLPIVSKCLIQQCKVHVKGQPIETIQVYIYIIESMHWSNHPLLPLMYFPPLLSILQFPPLTPPIPPSLLSISLLSPPIPSSRSFHFPFSPSGPLLPYPLVSSDTAPTLLPSLSVSSNSIPSPPPILSSLLQFHPFSFSGFVRIGRLRISIVGKTLTLQPHTCDGINACCNNLENDTL